MKALSHNFYMAVNTVNNYNILKRLYKQIKKNNLSITTVNIELGFDFYYSICFFLNYSFSIDIVIDIVL